MEYTIFINVKVCGMSIKYMFYKSNRKNLIYVIAVTLLLIYDIYTTVISVNRVGHMGINMVFLSIMLIIIVFLYYYVFKILKWSRTNVEFEY
jgi:VIT1/CCC1 family predicted Fe2+/Mn2+ transporter